LFAGLLEDLSQLFGFLAETIGSLIETVLPILLELFERAAPIVGEVLKIVARLAERVFPVLLRVIDKLLPVLGDVFLSILEALVPVFDTIADVIVDLMPTLEMMGDVIADAFVALKPILPQIAAAIIAVVEAFAPLLPQLYEMIAMLVVALTPLLLDGLVKAIEAMAFVLDKVLAVLRPIINGLSQFIDWIAQGISKFTTLGDVFAGIWNGIQLAIGYGLAFISGIWDKIKNGFSGAWNAIKTAFDLVWNPLKSAVDGLLGVARGVWNGVKNGFIEAWNAIARAWNSTVGSLSFRIPHWVPFFGGKGWDVPDIPLVGGGKSSAPGGGLGGPTTSFSNVMDTLGAVLARGRAQAGTAGAAGSAGPVVQIGTANFNNGTDVDTMAQRVYVAIRAQGQAA